MSNSPKVNREAKERQRFYPFLNACGFDRVKAAEMLADDPTLLDARNGIKETVLHFFAVENVLPAVQWLLERDSDLNTRNHFGSTPLIEAASLGHLEMCRLLLDNGADITVQDQRGQSAISAAVASLGRSHDSGEITLALVTLLLEHLGKDENINCYFDPWTAGEALAREDQAAELLLKRGLKQPPWLE